MVHRLTSSNRRIFYVLSVAGTLFFLGLAAAGFALIDRFDQTNQRRAQQIEFNQHIIDQQVKFICFFKTYVLTQPPSNPKPGDKIRVERFFSGALHSVGAPVTACETHPGNPN